MGIGKAAALAMGAGAATLVYGALVESNRLVLERRTLPLRDWPERLYGFRIALLGDFHIRDRWSFDLGRRAVDLALEQNPDAVAIVGDFVGYWKHDSVDMLTAMLEPLMIMEGAVVAVPGNHDYPEPGVRLLGDILSQLNVRLLRNAAWTRGGVTWVGVDSARAGRADPVLAAVEVKGPRIALWHEPDLTHHLPPMSLQLSGHSHGGQFRFPFGFTPMHSRLGERYVAGYYTDTKTPLYVTRGIGTTGPPSRFLCPPEVTLLTLVPA